VKVKTKLRLGIGLLFSLIVILVALAVRQVHVIADDTENILVANYNSLDYSRNMLKEFDKIEIENQSFANFDKFLKLQTSNITEIGEKELTQNLTEDVKAFKQNPKNKTVLSQIRKDLNDIMKLNMDSIQRKSIVAKKSAESGIFWISITGLTCFIIAFTLLVNLPSDIANPIKDLTESIRQIAAKNYSQRVNFETNDEFGNLAKSFNTMAEKLQEYSDSNLDKLMMEKKRIETLINNMHDPAIGLDENGKILFANEEALKISGLKASDIIGKNAHEVALSNDLVRLLLQHLVEGNIKKMQEILKIYADKKESYFEKQVIPIVILPTGEEQKKEAGSFIILKNVTAHKELDFAKTNFIAMVSHEFKTPIASMKMSLQLLENENIGSLNTEQKQLVCSIKDDTKRLLRTTGELLDITQVETGKAHLNIEKLDVKESISEALEATKTLAEQKNIKIKVSLSEVMEMVNADREKTTWVISNLVSNAIRYSHEDSCIKISATQKNDFIEIKVKDNGIGISSQYTEKIFDKYFRIPGTEKEGTGLGLAISKEFMDAQAGMISVKSDLGLGSEFSIHLPIR